MKELIVEVKGHPETKLKFYPGPSQCGGIKDGVSFSHGNCGGWVISFIDLERMYKYAKSIRAKP